MLKFRRKKPLFVFQCVNKAGRVTLVTLVFSYNSREQAAMDRPKWQTSVRSGAKSHGANRIAAAEKRRQGRKRRALGRQRGRVV